MPVDYGKSPGIDREKALKIIDKAGIDGEFEDVEELYSGWNSTYKLETDSQKYCIRVFINDFGECGVEWKADKEHYMHNQMVENGVNIPDSIFKDTSKTIIDYNYVILEFEEGMPLKDISHPLTSREDYLQILEDIGEQMALIHQTPMPKLSKYNFPLGQDFKNLREGIKHHLEYCPDEKTRKKILDRLDALEQRLPEEPKLVPVHTEITDRNVLVNKEENRQHLSSVIDVEWAVKALPEREFARPTFELVYFQNDEENFRKRLEHLLKGYYRKGGVLENPEAIPMMIIHHLLWGSRESPEKNVSKIHKTFEKEEKIISEYKRAIENLEG